ncbi:MAG: AarF/ABC1/UbiB kinase family protein [Verrucomicrobiota bacterium]|nr:AarF/ABC1/UbiB kinase family protein [Verrucomicrobiota bacterium]
MQKIKTAVEMYTLLPRYKEIIAVLFKYGFGEILELVHLKKRLDIEDDPEKQNKDFHSKPMPVRFRLALEELGPTFVKFGQILSSRRDLVTDEILEELTKLQNEVPPFPGEEAKRIIEHDLECPLDEIFLEFEIVPIAAASMAQVHRAVLQSGEVVAVKVQRPGIKDKIDSDLHILQDVAKLIEKYSEELKVLNPEDVVKEFAKTIRAEQDFRIEAQNIARFGKQFSRSTFVKVPKVYEDLCTEHVLTMEFLECHKIEDPEYIRKQGIDPIKLSERLSRLIFQQIFEFGFFHGDPHPGNIGATKNETVVVYDYGMMGNLTIEFRQDIATLIVGLAEKDHRRVSQALLGMSVSGFAEDLPKLESDVVVFSEQYLDKPLKDLKLGYVFNRLIHLLAEHHLRMKGEFYLGIKALTQVEALGQILNPNLNFVRFGKPFATKVMIDKYDPAKIFKNFYFGAIECVESLKDFPIELRNFARQVKNGQYSIPLEHKIDPEGYEPLRQTLNHIANRIANALITSALLIGSSILCLAKVPPVVHDIPLLGVIGFAIGTWLGIRLMLAIWKRGGY